MTESSVQSCASWSVVRQLISSAGLVATAMPSFATWTSVYSIPSFSQSGTSSFGSIGREALEMSVSPAQNFSKPPPVPAAPTVMLTSGFSSANSSAAASANGCTVLEPSMAMLPDRPLGFAAAAAVVVVVAAGRNAEGEQAAAADCEQPLLRDHVNGLPLG